MPVFNTAPHVVRAINSALNQSGTVGEVEVVVVDDGSTDESLSLIKRLAERDPRVRLFAQPNRGAASARNRAMAEARGELFALLDSDDEWMPDYLATQMSTLRRHPEVSIVTANVFERDGPADGQPYWPASDTLRPLSLLDLIQQEDAVCIMSVFRREVHETIGGFDETFVRGSEDYDFWLRAAAAGFLFLQQRRPLGFYQRRPDSASASQLNMLEGICRALERAKSTDQLKGAERAAIERQLLRFEQQRLRCEAILALRSRNFGAAADGFKALHKAKGGLRLAVVAAWSRYAPSSLMRIDALRRSFSSRVSSTKPAAAHHHPGGVWPTT